MNINGEMFIVKLKIIGTPISNAGSFVILGPRSIFLLHYCEKIYRQWHSKINDVTRVIFTLLTTLSAQVRNASFRNSLS